MFDAGRPKQSMPVAQSHRIAAIAVILFGAVVAREARAAEVMVVQQDTTPVVSRPAVGGRIVAYVDAGFPFIVLGRRGEWLEVSSLRPGPAGQTLWVPAARLGPAIYGEAPVSFQTMAAPAIAAKFRMRSDGANDSAFNSAVGADTGQPTSRTMTNSGAASAFAAGLRGQSVPSSQGAGAIQSGQTTAAQSSSTTGSAQSAGNTTTSSTPALGNPTPALGNSTPAMGNPTTALGNATPAMGNPTPALGNSTPALGNPTPAMGNSATSFANTSMFAN